jgi:hypothetical protein
MFNCDHQVLFGLTKLYGLGWPWLALAGLGWPWLALAGLGWPWLAVADAVFIEKM